jgi:hypothetical protein
MCASNSWPTAANLTTPYGGIEGEIEGGGGFS